jgi:hypothetical protein
MNPALAIIAVHGESSQSRKARSQKKDIGYFEEHSMLVNKSHPALKQGGYSTTTILPTESVAEFEKLHRDLISELAPNSALADDIVATIRRMVWRKRNLPTFRIAVVARFNYEIIMSREFSRMLPEETLPPELLGRAGAYTEAEATKIEAISDVARKELGDDAYKLANVGEIATVNGLMNDLEVRERLNAIVERCLKRLLFVKGLESILAPSSSLPSKRLAGSRRKPASAKRSMPVRVKKSHPALKHGGYAATVVLPGESVAEFEKQLRELIANFAANGALEEDIVADLAGRLWRKQNRATFRTAEVARQHHREIVRRELDTYYAHEPTEREKEAREWYGMSEEEELRKKARLAEREKAIRAADDIARHELGDMYELAKMADTVTVACLMKDLAVEERLDAAIDKCLKRLLFVKGVKSISASSSSAPPKRVAGPSEAA